MARVGNHFEFIGGDIKQMLMEIKIQENDGKGRMRDLLIEDNTFERDSEKSSRLQGLDAEHEITNVTFDNLVIAGHKCLNAKNAGIEIKNHVNGVTFQ